jgi:3,4-dihydroxy 2-butanone 4-phosphate synthase/GTP cyclohydrolase II
VARLPTTHGDFVAYGYRSAPSEAEHVALVMGRLRGEHDVLARVHSECLTGDVFGSQRCDCGMQLSEALRLVAAEGRGIIVYNRDQEGRGIGLLAKLAAYGLQDEGLDTVEANVTLGFPADGRDYGVAAQILHDLGVGSVRLLTNNPEKIRQLGVWGVTVSGRVPHEVGLTRHNDAYLATKAEKLGHLITGNGTDSSD